MLKSCACEPGSNATTVYPLARTAVECNCQVQIVALGHRGEKPYMNVLFQVTSTWRRLQVNLPDFLMDGIKYWPTAVIPAGLAVVGSAIFTRIFPAATYGVFILLSAALGPLVAVSSQPFEQPLGRFFAEYKAQNQRDLFLAVARVLLVTGVTLALVLGMAAWALANVVAPFHLFAPSLLAGGAVALIVLTAIAIMEPLLSAGFQIAQYRRIVLGTSVLGLTFTLILMGILGPQVSWLIWGPALASVIFLPVILKSTGIVSRRRVDVSRTSVIHTARRFVRFGSPMALWFLAFSLLAVGDRYVIQWAQGAAAVGVYGVSYGLASQSIGLVSGPYMNGCWPRIMQLWANKERDLVRRQLYLMTDNYLLLGIGLVGILAVIGHPLLRLLVGASFTRGFVILVPVGAGRVVAGMSTLGHKTMELLEKNSLMVWDALIAASINLALNVWAVPRWGFIAAGYTTLISYVAYTALVWWQARSRLPWDIPYGRLFGYVMSATAAWFFAHALALHVVNLVVATLLGTLAFGTMYASLAFGYRKYVGKRSIRL